MPYCSDCGVTFEARHALCPLCGGSATEDEPDLPAYAPLEPVERRRAWKRLLVTAHALLAATVVTIVLIVDLVPDGAIGWSRYVLLALPASWGMLAALLLIRKPVAAVSAAIAVVAALLAGIDLFSGGGGQWFVRIALPICLVVGVVFSVELVALPRIRTSSQVAFVLFGSAVVAMGVELAIAWGGGGVFAVTWSGVVAVSTVPIGGFLLMLQQTVMRSVDFRRLFHL